MPKKTRLDLEKFKASVDIIGLATSLGYDLKRSGNTFISHCPNCEDEGNKRHLTFYPAKNIFVCHKCNKVKGDVISLIKYSLGLDFVGVISWIEEHYGSEFQLVKPAKRLAKTFKRPVIRPQPFIPCHEIGELHLKIYQSFYSLLSLPGQVARYLSITRSIPLELIQKYGIKGIDGNHAVISQGLQKQYKTGDLVASGVFARTGDRAPYLRFYDDCVIFPHYYKDRLVYFSTRNLETRQQGRKSFPMPNIVFYNLDALERHRIIYLFEGIINGLSYETLCAKDNYICTLGIKADECLKLAASYPDIEFRLAYDPDEAGLRAAMSIERKLPNLSSDPGYYKALFKRYLPELPWSDQDTGMDMNDLLCHLGYPYEERAAIMEVDAGLPRPEAEKSSLALLMRETNQL